MNERNNQLAQAGLAAAGGVIAAGGAKSGNNNAVGVGAVTALSGLGWAMGSQYSKEDRDAYFELIFGLLAAIVLVYLLIVVNLQSWLDPFIIITALPGALAGIAWALFLTHTRLSEPA